jgi:hypothetical protein
MDPLAKWRQQEPASDPLAKWRSTQEEEANQTLTPDEKLQVSGAMSWGDAFKAGAANAPQNAKDVAGGLIDTAARYGGLFGGGKAIYDFYNAATTPGKPQQMLSDTAKYYGDYSSEAGLKDKIANNPVGTALDVGTLVTPFKVGRATVTGRAAPKMPKVTEVPNTPDLKGMASSLYKEADDAGMAMPLDSYSRLVASIVHAAKKEGFDRSLHPGTKAAVQRLISEIPKDTPPDAMHKITKVPGRKAQKTFALEDVDTLRKVVGAARRSKDPNLADDRRIAGIVSDRIDEWIDNPSNWSGGDVEKGSKAIRAARSLVVRYKKAEILDKAHENALDRVGANYTNAGLQTALRQEFKTVKKSHDFKKFSPEEKAVITSIVRGASAENLLRWAGKFAPSSPMATVLTIFTGHSLGGPVGAAALMGAGQLAKNASTKMGQKKVNRLNALVRRGYDSQDASF